MKKNKYNTSMKILLDEGISRLDGPGYLGQYIPRCDIQIPSQIYQFIFAYSENKKDGGPDDHTGLMKYLANSLPAQALTGIEQSLADPDNFRVLQKFLGLYLTATTTAVECRLIQVYLDKIGMIVGKIVGQAEETETAKSDASGEFLAILNDISIESEVLKKVSDIMKDDYDTGTLQRKIIRPIRAKSYNVVLLENFTKEYYSNSKFDDLKLEEDILILEDQLEKCSKINTGYGIDEVYERFCDILNLQKSPDTERAINSIENNIAAADKASVGAQFLKKLIIYYFASDGVGLAFQSYRTPVLLRTLPTSVVNKFKNWDTILSRYLQNLRR